MKLYVRNFSGIILSVIMLAMCGVLAAQADSATYSLRPFDKAALNKYSGQRDFMYDRDAPPADMNIITRLWHQFLNMLTEVFGEEADLTVTKVAIYILMIFAAVMIILNLVGIDIRRLLVRDAQVIIAPYTEAENIREMNMDDLIADAAGRRQWRLSVRYQYLKALRMLTDRELISWRAGKTNMDYYYELNNAALKSAFLTATDEFENAWYGNGEVTEGQYLESKKNLEHFYTQIQNHSA